MGRLLITRPQPDAARLAAAARARGWDTMIAPVMEIAFPSGPSIDLSSFDALAVTSANGARAIAERSSVRDLPAFAVGETTAAALKAEGFADVRAAGGELESLAALIAETCRPGARVYHPAGRDRAGDLAGRLAQAGISATVETLYAAEAATRLPPAAEAFFTSDEPDRWASFFSQRTAKIFVDLLIAAGLEDRAADVGAVALSEAAAEPLHCLSWRAVAVAPHTSQTALLETLPAVR